MRLAARFVRVVCCLRFRGKIEERWYTYVSIGLRTEWLPEPTAVLDLETPYHRRVNLWRGEEYWRIICICLALI